METQELFAKIKSIFPSLAEDSKKGQNGKVAVVGGSYEFSGPPYYAAMATLRVGIDMAHIFCPKTSATAIKSYSPDLIVHPIFDIEQEVEFEENQLQKVFDSWVKVIKKWEKDIWAWVIGPGLGADKYIAKFFPKLVRSIPQDSVIVFDADGILYLCQHPQLFKDLKRYKAILTPNKTELKLIEKTLNIQIESIFEKFQKQEREIVEFEHEWKQNFTVFCKGSKDIILGPKCFVISVQGGLKRSSNIGDILAGSVAACSDWDFEYGPALASIIVRMATKKGFEKEGRSLTSMGIIQEIVTTIQILEAQPPHL